MRIVLQRVAHASVAIDGQTVGEIGSGLLLLIGVAPEDTPAVAEKMVQKLLALRIFPDEAGKMNRSIADTGGGILAISQFTLFADCRKGNRPSFTGGAPPAYASALYDAFVQLLRQRHPGPVATGRFGADMKVTLLNDGPVTLVLDSNELWASY